MSNLFFSTSVTVDELSGDLISVYFRVRKGRVSETREFADGSAFADYNRKGELIGIELLGPCKVSIVDQLAANESVSLRTQTKNFMKQSGPRSMIAV